MADNLNVLFHLELTHNALYVRVLPMATLFPGRGGKEVCHQSDSRKVLVGPGELACSGDAAPVPHLNLSWESLQGPEAEGCRPPRPVAGAAWTEGLELAVMSQENRSWWPQTKGALTSSDIFGELGGSKLSWNLGLWFANSLSQL